MRILERDVGGIIGIGCALCSFLQRVIRPQAVANIGLPTLKYGMPFDEIGVYPSSADNVISNGVEDGQVALRRKNQTDIGEIKTAVLERRQNSDPHMGRGQPAIRHPSPQQRVHLGHVRTPQHKRVGRLYVIVTTHRFVDAESAHEARDG